MIRLLPYWVLPDTDPAFYDIESKTVIEAVSKLYRKMNELIEGYNNFSQKMESEFIKFKGEIQEKQNAFETLMNTTYQKFISDIEAKMTEFENNMLLDQENFKTDINNTIADLTKQINEAIDYMKTNIKPFIKEQIKEMLESREIDFILRSTLDTSTEELTQVVVVDLGGE